MLKSINRACSPEKSLGIPKPRLMAWAGMTPHLRCSPLTGEGTFPMPGSVSFKESKSLPLAQRDQSRGSGRTETGWQIHLWEKPVARLDRQAAGKNPSS
jgi:hypothetical protein